MPSGQISSGGKNIDVRLCRTYRTVVAYSVNLARVQKQKKLIELDIILNFKNDIRLEELCKLYYRYTYKLYLFNFITLVVLLIYQYYSPSL